MKVIHSGGVNASLGKDDPSYDIYGFGNYFMVQVRDELERLIANGKKVAVCVAAKPNKEHYHQRFIDNGFSPEDFTFLGREDNADWGSYDAILLLGGETRELSNWLVRTNFDVTNLSNCQLLAGDSAGAYVLAAKVIVDYEVDGSSFEITDGFMPDFNVLIAAHVNNTYYHSESLGKVLAEWCEENKVEYVELKENELKITNL